MPKASRRRLATLIRIRQEVEKRLDRVAPYLRGPSSLGALLTPSLSELATSSDRDALRRALAAASQDRFPLPHLRGRDAGSLPAREPLERSVADAESGRWSVFGIPLAIDPARHEWNRHPTSRAVVSRLHWSRVRYMDGIAGGDVKVIWELSRHHHLVRLAQGYYLDRDEATSERLMVLLDSWIAENPHGIGINWTSSLEVAFRAIAWCWIWALTCQSSAWTPARVQRFLVSLWHHARHIERFDSIHHSPNTHLTGEGLGLLYVGLMFPELRRAADWAALGQDILESELDAQILSDGMHYERSVGYHKYTAEFYLHYLLLARAFGLEVPDSARDRVRAQVDAAQLLRRPDGTWPVIGDEDSGDTLLLAPVDPQDQGPVLALGASLFRDQDLVRFTTDAHRAAAWWLVDQPAWQWLRDAADRGSSGSDRAYFATRARRREPVMERDSGALPAAGYFVGRESEGADAWWCLVDAGPHGGDRTGHAHTDLGHVEIARGATHVVVDPGCAGYTIGRPARDHARSEAAHACLVIERSSLAEPAGSFSWTRLAPTPTHRFGDDGHVWWCDLAYERDALGGRLAHRRQVLLVRGVGVIICDWIAGVTDGPIAVHWPLGIPPNEVSLSGSAMITPHYQVAWSGAMGPLDATVESTTRAPGYARQVDAALLRLGYRGQLPLSVVTSFTNPATRLGRHLHDGESVRLELPDGETGPARVLSIRAGEAPSLDAMDAPASSLPVLR
ncbi:MAG TPA: alginate lyase family protein [Gemmatimonadaceae bacterium]|nr:alginate lyase family protein [Gemmatimonadaceae bacterium]